MPEMHLRQTDFCSTFASNSSANVKLSKNQLWKIKHLVEFPGRLFGPLINNHSSRMYSHHWPIVC